MDDLPDPSTGGVRSRISRFLAGRAKRWVIGIVLVNLVAVLVLAGIGSARVERCNGGFSGYSGGGGGGGQCVADLDVNPYVASSGPAKVGQRLVYLLTMRNHGPDRAFGISLTVRIPKGVQVDWWMSSAGEYGGGCEFSNRVVSCFFYQDLDKGGSVAATVVIVPYVSGIIRTSVSASAEGAQDPNPHNNNITIKTSVAP